MTHLFTRTKPTWALISCLATILALSAPVAQAFDMNKCATFAGSTARQAEMELQKSQEELFRFAQSFPELRTGRADRGDRYILELLDRELEIMKLSSRGLVLMHLALNSAPPSIRKQSEGDLRAFVDGTDKAFKDSLRNAQTVAADMQTSAYMSGAFKALRAMERFYAAHAACR